MLIMENFVHDTFRLVMLRLLRRHMFDRNCVTLRTVGQRRQLYAWRIHGEHATFAQRARQLLLVDVPWQGVAAGERATSVTLMVGALLLVLARDDQGRRRCRITRVVLNKFHVDLLRRVLRDVHAHSELVGVVYDRRVVVHAHCHVVDLMC